MDEQKTSALEANGLNRPDNKTRIMYSSPDDAFPPPKEHKDCTFRATSHDSLEHICPASSDETSFFRLDVSGPLTIPFEAVIANP